MRNRGGGAVFAYLPLARSGSQFVEDGAETVGLRGGEFAAKQPRANLVEEKCAIDVRDVRPSAWLPAMKATTIHTSGHIHVIRVYGSDA